LGIDKGILPIGPSSANMGFTIAEALGCNPIILVGQDLAYAPDGRTHAADNALGEKQEGILPDKSETLWVKGNYEERIMTTPVWQMFLKNYENIIKNYSGTCINATEGGAFIPGTEIMDLAEVKEKFLNRNTAISEIIKTYLKPPAFNEIQTDYKKLINILSEGVKDLSRFIDECREWEEKVRDYLETFPEDTAHAEEQYAKNIAFISDMKSYKETLVNHPAYTGIMVHIMQSFLIGKEIIINAVPPYYNPNPLGAQRGIIAEHVDWFKTNGEIMGRTRHILKRHLGRIKRTFKEFQGENQQ